jgi:hypothetical protein
MIPESFRPVAKAIVGAIVPLATVLVAVGVLDVDVANKVTTDLIAIAVALGLVSGGSVYATRNR